MGKHSARWVYCLENNYTWDSKLPIPEDKVFKDAKGKVRLILEEGGKITITKGYCWNGCSPKIYLFDLVFGTPDGVTHENTGHPKTYYASLVHDALYQFLETDKLINRKEADACFLDLMEEADFALRTFYWMVVRLIGWPIWYFTKLKRTWSGECKSINSFL